MPVLLVLLVLLLLQRVMETARQSMPGPRRRAAAADGAAGEGFSPAPIRSRARVLFQRSLSLCSVSGGGAACKTGREERPEEEEGGRVEGWRREKTIRRAAREESYGNHC